MQNAARIDSESRDAFSALLNTARDGGLIAVVLAHGATSRKQTRRQELHVVSSGTSCDINRLIPQIGSRKDPDGTQRYRLLYFNACNPDRVPISMGTGGVPVIVHTNDNVSPYAGFSTAKAYWPHDKRASPFDLLMTKMRRR